MQVKLIDVKGSWEAVRTECLFSLGLTPKNPMANDWIMRILLSEDSPIRGVEYVLQCDDVPYWVAMHLVRHHVGIRFTLKSQRSDITGINRDELPQASPCSFIVTVNAQAVIDVSRKRLCRNTATKTRMLWMLILNKITQYTPEMSIAAMPDCQYRGNKCYKFKSCGLCPRPDNYPWLVTKKDSIQYPADLNGYPWLVTEKDSIQDSTNSNS